MAQHGMFLSSLASLFARIMLDPRYDELADHAIPRELRAAGAGKRLGAVSLLNAVGAYVDTHLRIDSPIRKFFTDIAVDGTAELGSRIIYGPRGRSGDLYRPAELTEDQLVTFLDWYERADGPTRKAVRTFVVRQTAGQLAHLLAMHPNTRDRLMAFASESRPLIPRRIPAIDRIVARLRRPMFT